MDNITPEKQFNAFLPIFLVALSSVILLAWNLIIVRNQHNTGVQIMAQQETQLAQANQTEMKLKQIMSDLVDLAKTDLDAETIVKRYGISFNPPPAVATTPPEAATETPPVSP